MDQGSFIIALHVYAWSLYLYDSKRLSYELSLLMIIDQSGIKYWKNFPEKSNFR